MGETNIIDDPLTIGAAALSTPIHSNDSEELMGAPQEQTFTSVDFIGEIEDGEDEEATTQFEARSEGTNGPCSNDNPTFYEGTQPCPGAVDLEIDITTAAPVVSNNFGGDDGESEDTTINLPWTNTVSTTSTTTTGGGIGGNSGSSVATNKPGGDGDGVDIVTNNSNDEDILDVIGDDSDTSDGGNSNIDNGEPTPNHTVDPPPSFYSCSASTKEDLVNSNGNANNSNNNNEALPLIFNYEIYTSTNTNDDNITSILNTFERQLANGVASSLGLVDCNPEEDIAVEVAVRTGELPWGGRRRTLLHNKATTSGGEKERMLNAYDLVMGVSSDPVDELDTKISGCTSSATLDTPSKCFPIAGAMTAWLTTTQQRHLRQLQVDEDSKEAQETMLLNTIQTYIEQNQDSYLNDNLLHVAYIGQRNLGADFAVDGDGTDTDGTQVDGARDTDTVEINAKSSRVNYGLIGLAVAASVLAVVAIGAAWVYRRRRRRTTRQAMSGDDHRLDLEQGALFPALTPESASKDRDDNDTEDALPPPDDGESGYNNLFGLNGVQASDESMNEGRMAEPSSLAALGAASTLARQLSYSHPVTTTTTDASPNSPSSDQQDINMAQVQDTLASFDASIPTPTNNNQDPNSFDMYPLSPMTAEDNDDNSSVYSDISSVFEATEDEENDVLLSPASESTVGAKNGAAMAMFDDVVIPTTPSSPEEGDDDDDDDVDDSLESGMLV